MKEQDNVSQTVIDPESIDLKAVGEASDELSFDTLPLNEGIKGLVIWDINFKETKAYGEMAVVTSVDRRKDDPERYQEYHTFSEVLVDQFKMLKEKGKLPIRITVRKAKGEGGKAYFTLGNA